MSEQERREVTGADLEAAMTRVMEVGLTQMFESLLKNAQAEQQRCPTCGKPR